MAKFTLDVEYDYDFDLIGICSHNADYRVCWSINEHLKTELVKVDEPFLVQGKKGAIVSTHSQYKWENTEEDATYYIIENKDKENGKLLIPEKGGIDFFLLIKERDIVDVEEILEKIKEVKCVLTAFIFDPENLKSADRLLFD